MKIFRPIFVLVFFSLLIVYLPSNSYADSRRSTVAPKAIVNTEKLSSDKKAKAADNGKMITQPHIEALLPVPLGPLKPNSKVFVKGNNFGTPKGRLILSGPNLPFVVELTAVQWENDKQVNGVVPAYLDNWPNQTVFIQVRRLDGALSNPQSIKFLGQVEYKCDSPHGLILGSDGSVTDCTPYVCRETAGVIQCLTGCKSTGDCKIGNVCDSEGNCVPNPN